jgi:hypothetical protein
MTCKSEATPVTLPFGKHRGKELGSVPSDYLLWGLRELKLSSGLRAAVAGELARRNVEAPAPPAPRPVPPCGRCGSAEYRCRWFVDSTNRRHVRATCARCGNGLGFLPSASPFSDEADAAQAEEGAGR